jgi:hypothetical protein
VDLPGALLRWSFGAGWAFEPFCSDGFCAPFAALLSGAAFCCDDGAWPVVPFCSDFCAPLELWPVVDDDWLLDDDELLSDFTLTLPSNPRAVTVRVSMRPFASKPSLRWKVISAARVRVSNTPVTRPRR